MPAAIPLTIYRRHATTCTVHDMNLKPRLKKKFMGCDCPIWMHGHARDGFVPRQSTGLRDIKEAEALYQSLVDPKQVDLGPTLEDCKTQFLKSQSHKLGEKAYGQNELVLNRLITYCAGRGVSHSQQLTVDLLERFKVEGIGEGLADTSRATLIAKLRSFIRVAGRRNWTTEPLIEKVEAFTAQYEQKSPYTNAEMQAILDESLNLRGGTHAYAAHAKTFRVLLDLMLETGMRCGDAVRFDPSVLVRGKHLWIYQFEMQKRKKSDKPKIIETYIPEELKERIDGCHWLSRRQPFAYGNKKTSYLVNEVYERMQTIGERCGVDDCRPHRIRDTFAVRKLLRGFSVDDVSRLLGHSSVKVTEAYYAKWVVSRRERLESLVAASVMDTNQNAFWDGSRDVGAFAGLSH